MTSRNCLDSYGIEEDSKVIPWSSHWWSCSQYPNGPQCCIRPHCPSWQRPSPRWTHHESKANSSTDRKKSYFSEEGDVSLVTSLLAGESDFIDQLKSQLAKEETGTGEVGNTGLVLLLIITGKRKTYDFLETRKFNFAFTDHATKNRVTGELGLCPDVTVDTVSLLLVLQVEARDGRMMGGLLTDIRNLGFLYSKIGGRGDKAYRSCRCRHRTHRWWGCRASWHPMRVITVESAKGHTWVL